MPRTQPEVLRLGWNNNEARVTEECVSVEVVYSCYEPRCCCGECWDSMGHEGETEFDMSRSEVIAIAKAMKIKPEELK